MHTTENGTGFVDYCLDMHGKFFGLGSDITTRSDDDERVCFAVRVLEIEPAEQHGRGSGDALTEGHSLAYPRYYWGGSALVFRKGAEGTRTISGEDVEEVKEQRVLHVAHILCSCLLEGCTVDDPPFTDGERVSMWRVGRGEN